ncbi:MAG: DUF4145 domain-containing protein [Acidimicrobiia bacterium]
MEIFHAPGWWNPAPTVVTLRCPGCRQLGTFEGGPQHPDTLDTGNATAGQGHFFGIRRCPNLECHALIFVVGHHEPGGGARVVASYPPEVIDFDASELPPPVLASLTEAVTCHAAGAYRASVLMVRRTLEEVCDEQGAEGRDLHARIETLRDKAILPAGFLEGMHDLRLLGGDAAHIELRWFDQVDRGEAEDAIEILKFLLIALYQSDALMGRLAARKRRES